MTLVLNVLTPNFVVQVSDRRLVWLRDESVEKYDDEKNKAVLWCGRLAFAYTGLAELGRERRTDLWLANTLSKIEQCLREEAESREDKDQFHLLKSLAEEATAYFAGPRISRWYSSYQRRHAFVAVGWAKFSGAPDFSPYLALISNYHDDDWNELPEAEDAFLGGFRRLRDDGGFVLPIGHPISPAELDALVGELRAIDDDPLAVVITLGEKIREVASNTDTVGRGLMANVLPRNALKTEGEFMAVFGAPSDGLQTFLYVPKDDDPPGEMYGPTVVCGGTVITGLAVASL